MEEGSQNSTPILRAILGMCYCETWNVHVEEIFTVYPKKTQIHHPTNWFPSTRLKKFKIEKVQNFRAANISCLTVYDQQSVKCQSMTGFQDVNNQITCNRT